MRERGPERREFLKLIIGGVGSVMFAGGTADAVGQVFRERQEYPDGNIPEDKKNEIAKRIVIDSTIAILGGITYGVIVFGPNQE